MTYKLYDGRPIVETSTYTPEPVTRVSIAHHSDKVNVTFHGDSVQIGMDEGDYFFQLNCMEKKTALALADAIRAHFQQEEE